MRLHRVFNVAFAFLYLNRLAEADALLRKASERNIEVIEFSLWLTQKFIRLLAGAIRRCGGAARSWTRAVLRRIDAFRNPASKRVSILYLRT